MRITERKLRKIIRSVIREGMDLVKNSRGNIDLNQRGEKISSTQACDLFDEPGARKATDSDMDVLYKLLARQNGGANTNEFIISPNAGPRELNKARRDEPYTLIPLFVIEDFCIVFAQVGGGQHYKLMLSGEEFRDTGVGYHGEDPNKEYSNPEGTLFNNRLKGLPGKKEREEALKRKNDKMIAKWEEKERKEREDGLKVTW